MRRRITTDWGKRADAFRHSQSEPLKREAELTLQVKGMESIYQQPVPHNRKHVFFPKWRIVHESISAMASDAQSANSCDWAMYRFLSNQVNSLQASSSVKNCFCSMLNTWLSQLTLGNHFASVDIVELIVSSMLRLGVVSNFEVPQTLREQFLAIPRRFLGVLRVSMSVPPFVMTELLGELAAIFVANRCHLSGMERLEIPHGFSESQKGYVQITFSFDHDTVDVKSWNQIKHMMAIATAYTASQAIAPRWTIPLVTGVDVGQGFNAFKRYLEVASCLSALYDPKSSHAFLRGYRIANH